MATTAYCLDILTMACNDLAQKYTSSYENCCILSIIQILLAEPDQATLIFGAVGGHYLYPEVEYQAVVALSSEETGFASGANKPEQLLQAATSDQYFMTEHR